MNIVKPGNIKGSLPAPGSKSQMQRVVALACLAQTPTTICNPSLCDDSLASLEIIEALGAKVARLEDKIEITPHVTLTRNKVMCKESGTSLRIFSAVASLYSQEIVLDASGTLLKRPMDMVTGPLTELGAKCLLQNGFPPITIQGPIRGGNIEIDGSATSQLLSGLLIALPCADDDSIITVKNLKSRPYVEMTLDTIKLFGGKIGYDDTLTIFSIPAKQKYVGIDTSIEGDWSGASFLLVAGALAGSVTVTHLYAQSSQGDKAILNALNDCGAAVTINKESITVHKQRLNAFEFDATNCPDLFPPLVALASGCSGVSRITGVHRLVHKESDRAHALQAEFKKLGITIEIEDDTFLVSGGTVNGGEVSSHHDHRIAMACGVAALSARDPVKIDGASCVSKSYPSFFSDLDSIRSEL